MRRAALVVLAALLSIAATCGGTPDGLPDKLSLGPCSPDSETKCGPGETCVSILVGRVPNATFQRDICVKADDPRPTPSPSVSATPTPSPSDDPHNCFDNRATADVGRPVRVRCDDCRATGCGPNDVCREDPAFPVWVCHTLPSPTPPPSVHPGCEVGHPCKLECWWGDKPCPRYNHLTASVFQVHVAGQIQNRNGSPEKPLQPGDRVTFNATPRTRDTGCPRGAELPVKCQDYVNKPEWAASAGEIVREDSDTANGFLAVWRAPGPGRYIITVAQHGNVAQVPVVVQ